jgi:site-specific recombinase XerD
VVEGWARELREKGYQPTSIRRKLAALRALCNYWVRRNVLAASPFWRLRLNLGSARTLPRVLSADEVAALLREAARRARAHPAAARHGLGPGFLAVRDLAIVELLFATGVRVGELVGIRLDDLSLQERSILIRGKGRRQRLAFLTEPQSLQAVQQYVKLRTALPALLAPMAAPADPTAERSDPATARSDQIAASAHRTTAPAGGPTAALFVNSAGRALTTQGVATALRGLAQAAGIPRRVTPHMLRHTVATLLLRNGADLRVVQEFLGHASIVMTQRYTQVAKEQLIRTLENHHPRAGFGG